MTKHVKSTTGQLLLLQLTMAWVVGCSGGEVEVAPPPIGSDFAEPQVDHGAEPSSPQLTGAYELVWMQDAPDQPQQQMPQGVIGQLPGCIWARWGWEFGDDGQLSMENQMLCRAPAELGSGHGVCRAHFETAIRWNDGGFTIPTPIQSESQFINLRSGGPQGELRRATVRCNVSVGAVRVVLADIDPGTAPSRPEQVTLIMSDGGRMRLRSIPSNEVDFARLIRDNETSR